MNTGNIIKKISVGVFGLVFIVSASLVSAPRPAHAWGINIDPFNLVQNTISAVTSSKQLLAPIAWTLSRAAIQSIVASTVRWINSGFNGSPGYVTNLSETLSSVADAQANIYFGQLLNSNALIRSPYQDQVYQYIRNNYQKSTARDAILGAHEYDLDLHTVNASGFLAGATTQGGLNAWFAAITNPANTPVGAMQIAQNELAASVIGAQEERKTELNWSQGILSFRGKCNSSTSSNTVSLSSAEPCYGASIQTPGSIIKASLDKTFGSGIDSLVSAKDFDEIVSALLSQLILHISGGAGSLRGLSDPSSSTGGTTYFNQTDPSQAAANTSVSSDFASILTSQTTQMQQFQSQWQTIYTAAQAAQSSLNSQSCPMNSNTLTNVVRPVIDQATTEISNAQTTLSTLSTIQSELPVSGSQDSTAKITKATNDYSAMLASATTPSTSDLTYASAQSTDTGTSTPASLYTQMNQIANNAYKCQAIY